MLNGELEVEEVAEGVSVRMVMRKEEGVLVRMAKTGEEEVV